MRGCHGTPPTLNFAAIFPRAGKSNGPSPVRRAVACDPTTLDRTGTKKISVIRKNLRAPAPTVRARQRLEIWTPLPLPSGRLAGSQIPLADGFIGSNPWKVGVRVAQNFARPKKNPRVRPPPVRAVTKPVRSRPPL